MTGKHKPILPEDPAVGIQFASAFLGRHKVTIVNQLNPRRPEFDAELAACAYRETSGSPWKFIWSKLHDLRERAIARSQEREQQRAGAE